MNESFIKGFLKTAAKMPVPSALKPPSLKSIAQSGLSAQMRTASSSAKSAIDASQAMRNVAGSVKPT